MYALLCDCCVMVLNGIAVIYHMEVTAKETMWCVTLVPVPYIACRDSSCATSLIRDRVVSSALQFGYSKTSGRIYKQAPISKYRKSKLKSKHYCFSISIFVQKDVVQKKKPQQRTFQGNFKHIKITHG